MKIEITESTKFNKPSFERPHLIEREGSGKGIQKLWRFKNGYGASVVRFIIETTLLPPNSSSGSYGADKGLWELAVIKFNEDGSFDLVYTTKITNDVIGYLTEAEVEKYLKKIKNMKGGN